MNKHTIMLRACDDVVELLKLFDMKIVNKSDELILETLFNQLHKKVNEISMRSTN